MTKKVYILVFSVVLLLVGGLTYFAVDSADATDNKTNNPSSLIGNWHQTNGQDTGTGFTAEISAGGIQINYPMRDGSGGIFWLGTFDGTHVAEGSFVIKSLPDQDALANDILASTEKIKSFTYKNGDMSFDFSVMKVHTTVHMSKSETK